MDLMRIPLATIMFLGSVFLLSTYFINQNDTMGTIGSFVCIVALVFSFMLYSNINIVR